MDQQDPKQPDEIRRLLELIRTRLGLFTVAMMLMVLVVLLSPAVIYGQMANWFGGDPLLSGGVATGAAVIGFILGFLAGRRL